MDAHAAAGLVVAHCATGKERVEAGRHSSARRRALSLVRQAAEREDRPVSGRR